MATIDLIVLGILRQEPLSAYDIQKLVEYRHISKWVKISTPSIYKKVIQLESKGYVKSSMVKEGKMPEKAVYSLTDEGIAQFEKLMFDIAKEPIRILLDFNAVIVNLRSLETDKQRECLLMIQDNITAIKLQMENNFDAKNSVDNIPETGLAVLKQQYLLIDAIEKWLSDIIV